MSKSSVWVAGDASQSPPKETHSESQGRRLRRPNVNLTAAERVDRMVIGVAGISVGVALLASSGSTLAVVLEVLLVLAGVDLLVTGAVGHCPLYQKLGYVPRSLREPR